MDTTRVSMNQSKNAELAFKEFSRNISCCIFNRILGIVSLLLIIASSVCLLLCYWLLTGSKYVEHIMVDICADMDLLYFQRIANDTIQSVSDTVNGWFGTRNFVSKTNIKSEFTSMLERHLAPDWANEDISDDNNHPVNEDDVEIKPEPNELNEKESNSETNEEDTCDSINELDEEDTCDSINELDEEDKEDEADKEVACINSSNNLQQEFDNEVEDITEQKLVEKETNKVVFDLTSDDES
jgi:hypothetical protein